MIAIDAHLTGCGQLRYAKPLPKYLGEVYSAIRVRCYVVSKILHPEQCIVRVVLKLGV